MKHSVKSVQWLAAPVRTVCAQIAAAALSDANTDNKTNTTGAIDSTLNLTLGNITLRPHQTDAVQRIRASIQSLGGALLADTVGLGKTYVALALARDYAHAHIIAPATLLPMWRSAVVATGATNVTLHSLQALSRRPIHIAATPSASIVVVDEAHHLRTRNTVRYRQAQQITTGRDVLLLSATPVHNRPRELRNLLALFLGRRADALDRNTLAQCVIRRTTNDAQSELVPAVYEHAAHAIPDNRAVLECILKLAPPLPVSDGTAASALVRLGLLRAWCSSDAALTDRIRRRQLRGEALLHSLTSGRYPTQRELESWIVGNDSVQLGFPELLAATASGDSALMLRTLVAHLDALQELLQVHTRTSVADASRSSALRTMLNAAHPSPIVAFSQFASTVRALHRALSDLAGVASLTSSGGQIASGAITRQELIANFAPKANGRPPPGVAQQIRLLLTTDLLAEGVNLQDAGIVVHLDLPWTHALQQQRVGRIARMGSSFSTVHVHTFSPPMGAEAALKLVATLERKAGLHRDLVGDDHDGSRQRTAASTSAPDEATQLRHLLLQWRTNSTRGEGESPLVAQVNASTPGWIAAIEHEQKRFVVTRLKSYNTDSTHGTFESTNPLGHIGTNLTRLLHAMRATWVLHDLQCTNDRSECDVPDESATDHALCDLHDWLRTHVLQSLAGAVPRSISPAQKRALDALSVRLSETAAIRRPALATLASNVEAQILRCRGAGAEEALLSWTSNSATLPITNWLEAFPETQRPLQAAPLVSTPDSESAPRVIALLLLQSPDGAPHVESLT